MIVYTVCLSVQFDTYIIFINLQASGQENVLEKVTLAVPAFHIYGHKGTCQVMICIYSNCIAN
jgi:hypothetical protein